MKLDNEFKRNVLIFLSFILGFFGIVCFGSTMNFAVAEKEVFLYIAAPIGAILEGFGVYGVWSLLTDVWVNGKKKDVEDERSDKSERRN